MHIFFFNPVKIAPASWRSPQIPALLLQPTITTLWSLFLALNAGITQQISVK